MKSRNKKRLLALVLCMVVAISNSSFIFASETGQAEYPQEAEVQTQDEAVADDMDVAAYAADEGQAVAEEQPAAVEQVVAEPAAEQETTAETPATEQPAAEAPAAEQPTIEAPAAEQPVAEASTVTESQNTEAGTITENEESEGNTSAEESIEEEDILSEATELKYEFRDAAGNIAETITAQIPEGAFKAHASEVTMEVEKLDAATDNHMKELIGKKLPENRVLGDYAFYQITFKVNGEKTDPEKLVNFTFEGSNLIVRDTDETNVCYLSPATDTVTQDELTNIISRENLEANLIAEGKTTEDLSEYQYSEVTLKEDNRTVNKVSLKGMKSTIYGFYVDEEPATLTYEDDSVVINVAEVREGAIPEGTSLSVIPVEKGTENYKAVEEKLNQKAEDEDYSVAGFLAYDITLIDKDGNKIEPDGNVKVTMDYKKEVIPENIENADSNLDVTVVHLEENAEGEVQQVVDMIADASEEATVETTDETKVTKAEFVTDSFSNYAIMWVGYDSTSGLPTIETVDHKNAGIKMTMTDMEGNNVDIKRRGTETYYRLGGEYGNGKIKPNLLKRTLDENGYPEAVNGQNLEGLFGDGKEVNHLFSLNTYNDTGYYEYSSFKNYAYLEDNGNFTVYDAIGTPKEENAYFYQRGNFMPYNNISANKVSKNKQWYDEDGNKLYPNYAGVKDENRNWIYQPYQDPSAKTLYKTDGTNYQFGMYMTANFIQPKAGKVKSPKDNTSNDMIFEFNGDDDLWIYIDGILVLDIGGVHDAHSGYINFSTGEVGWYDCKTGETPALTRSTIKDLFEKAEASTNGFKDNTFSDYSKHTFKMFYMERGGGASNLHMKFNLQVVPEGSVEVKKELSNTDKEQYSSETYKFKVYAQKSTATDSKGNETYGDIYEVLKSATYKGTTTPINFAGDGTFELKAGESAMFDNLKANRKYYVEEVSIDTTKYDKVEINGDEKSASTTVQTDKQTVESRPRVVYTNHCSDANSRELQITKKMKDNKVVIDTFSFKIQLSNSAGTLVPYANGDYYLKDAEGNYYYYNDEGELTSNRSTAKICGRTTAEGDVEDVPVDYTVVVKNLLAGTNFKVEEVNLDTRTYSDPVKTVNSTTCGPRQVTDADGTIVLQKDAKITITNEIKNSLGPEDPFIEVTKTFTGLTKDQVYELATANPPYQITVTNGDRTEPLVMETDSTKFSKKLTGSGTTWTYTWTIPNCSTGTYNVEESNYNKSGYQVTPTINGKTADNETVTTEKAQITYSGWSVTPCNQNDYTVSKINLIVAELTRNFGYFVWTREPASISSRMAIIEKIKTVWNRASFDNCYFFSGMDQIESTLVFRGGHIRYDGENTMHFDDPKQWTKFATGNYTVDSGHDAEVEFTNTYSDLTADLDLKKISKNSDQLFLEGAEFQLYKKINTTNTFEKFGDSVTVYNEDTKIEFKNLKPGQYYLKETKAPEGYLLLEDKIYFKQEKGTIKLIDEDGAALPYGTEFWRLKEGNILTIKNQVLYDLPSTGHTGIFNILMSGILLMFAGILIIYKMKGKEVLKK